VTSRLATALRRRRHLADAAFVAVVAALPALFYTRGLGFYLDDHLFLGMMSTSQDQSLHGLFDALTEDPKAKLRPLVYVVFATEYWLFGASPLAYHIVLAALVPACAVALYAVLVRLQLPRFLALATCVLFAAAPHYSSAKLWPLVFSPALSLTLALVSLLAADAAATGRSGRSWLWLAGACLAMLASIFMYEITLPLLVVGLLFFWVRAFRRSGRWRITAGVLTSVLAGALIVKLIATRTVGEETSYGVGFQDGLLHHMAYLVSGAVKLNFGSYGVGLPYVVSWIALNHLTWGAVAAALLVGVASFAYLARVVPVSVDDLPAWRGRPAWQWLAAAGLAVVVIGYGIFLTGANIYFTSAGIDNRVNIIPAVGMGLIALAVVLGALRFVPAGRRPAVFALAVATLAAVGTFITTTIGDYWHEAADRQREILSGLRVALPKDPAGTTVILDGTCPEVGPGIVFTAHYDLGGALQTMYRDPTLEGAVMTPVVSLGSRGVVLTTLVYDTVEPRLYRYRPGLVVYDTRRRRLEPLASLSDAKAYFASRRPLSCPPLRSFAWGFEISRYVPIN
jgi:hypothetical protein